MALNRRQFVASATALATLRSHAFAQAPATLGEAGARAGILAGAAIGMRSLDDFGPLLLQQSTIAVTDNDMKMYAMRPTPETFRFFEADRFVDMCGAHQIAARGHNFVWHQSLPAWFDTAITPENIEWFLIRHIHHIARRYAGRMHSWDVVNEAINLDDKLPNGFRNSPWQKLLPGTGLNDKHYVPAYIETAFRAAREADPHALLTYNDFGVESEWDKAEAKRHAVLQLLRNMQHRNIPIDAVGIQSHLDAGPDHRYGAGIRRFIADVRKMGLKVLITELDVNDRLLPADIPTRDAAVAEVYHRYLNEVLADPAVIAVLTWGLTDRATWLNAEKFSRKDGLPQRCLPFDKDLQPKPAFTAELNALQNAPRR